METPTYAAVGPTAWVLAVNSPRPVHVGMSLKLHIEITGNLAKVMVLVEGSPPRMLRTAKFLHGSPRPKRKDASVCTLLFLLQPSSSLNRILANHYVIPSQPFVDSSSQNNSLKAKALSWVFACQGLFGFPGRPQAQSPSTKKLQ